MASLFDDPPPDGPYRDSLPAQRHSPTSVAAAESVRGRVAAIREAVLRWIQTARIVDVKDGLTDEEGSALSGIGPSTYRPRRCELVQAGLVRDSGRTRRVRSGRNAVVWVATTPAE